MQPTEEDQFQMICPKCESESFTVRRDQRAYVHKSQPFELVFSCRCGTQLFGDKIQEEYDRQKVIWEAREPTAPKPPDEAELRRQEEATRREQLRKAMEYRRTYLAEKRKAAADAEKARREEEDRKWRERVAKVESQHGDTGYLREVRGSRKSKPAYSTRLGDPPPKVAKPKPVRKAPPPAAPVKAEAPAKPAARREVPPFDDSHPHAEFMAYLAEGTFELHFPECTPPDVKDPNQCVWPPCEKPRRKKSKYCSRECSNKNARWRHKMRKKV